ncbi:TetR/AcrR family transcriptional regulator [Kribbella sandramycini]|uniref:AcrR family transcriptional regulator n=1 Tax=Kribbella sandramycini TaxID=60450 RepID=A0A7Y4KV32_9ACTN|nr:TetR/AcrR family transcriptional regulator [Kribbella sandramycini]MBB6568152.1 AcrR family transcriptional regulator [Kribbella sandramycini]NOL39254.1 TetR/AcrR family transcriptional regulator [Kribbella sandramycini]
MAIDTATAQQQVLDAADALFYERGVQAVGMDAIRTASGVSLKRLYQLFPSKDVLIEAYLDRREIRWQTMLADHVEAKTDPRDRILAVFDFLYSWSNQRDYRGCAFINAFGELGTVSPRVAEMALQHKEGFRQALIQLGTAAGATDAERLADHLILLSEGAITRSAISGSPDPALRAREAATLILDASLPR